MTAAPSKPPIAPARSPFPWWLFVLGVLIPCIYLPVLTTNFDFIDDGLFVYPTGNQTLAEHINHVWAETVELYRTIGPFQPSFFLHMEWQGELFAGNPLYWRLLHQVWACLSALLLLWLMVELGIRPDAAVLAAAFALWNPFRAEIWIQLRPAEGNSFPFLMLALILALRASRKGRGWPLDLGGVFCVLWAIGFKNTAVAVVPAQILLRLIGGGLPWREAIRKHWRAGIVLALPVIVPAVHFVLYKANWQPGQVATGAPTFAQALRLIRAQGSAMGIAYSGAGIVLAWTALYLNWQRTAGDPAWAGPATGAPLGNAPREPSLFKRYRLPIVTGFALLVFGMAIYLPLPGTTGRYTLPAAWGMDLWLGVLLSALAELPASRSKRLAHLAFAVALVLIGCANLLRQQDFSARVGLLWEALETVERAAPPRSCFAWHDGPDHGYGEGMHFYYHLRSRGRRDLTFAPCESPGRVARSGPSRAAPLLWVSGIDHAPAGWQPLRHLAARTILGRKYLHLYVFARDGVGQVCNLP